MKYKRVVCATAPLLGIAFFAIPSARGQVVVPASVAGVEVLKPAVNPGYMYVGPVPGPAFNGDLSAYFHKDVPNLKADCKQFKLLLAIDSLGTAGQAKIISVCGQEYLPALQPLLQNMPRWTPARMAGKNIPMDVVLRFEIYQGSVVHVEMQ